MMKIAIQGIAGSFHHEAAEKMLGDDNEFLHCRTFQEVFAAVMNNQADRGVVAIENSLHGSINAVYRLLARNSLWVCGETSLHINQYLIAAEDRPVTTIETIMSQAPALAQCELWLEQNTPAAHIEETHDTADSVKYVVDHPREPIAAIASERAAKLYGGVIVAGPINDDSHNYTRFFLISKHRQPIVDATKTSIILETSHQPASLYDALGIFAGAKINLSKVDSHPIANDKNHYTFYIDFEARLDDNMEHRIFDKLHSQGCQITVLGSYKSLG